MMILVEFKYKIVHIYSHRPCKKYAKKFDCIKN